MDWPAAITSRKPTGLRAELLRMLEPDEGDPFNADRSYAIDMIVSTSSS